MGQFPHNQFTMLLGLVARGLGRTDFVQIGIKRRAKRLQFTLTFEAGR